MNIKILPLDQNQNHIFGPQQTSIYSDILRLVIHFLQCFTYQAICTIICILSLGIN